MSTRLLAPALTLGITLAGASWAAAQDIGTGSSSSGSSGSGSSSGFGSVNTGGTSGGGGGLTGGSNGNSFLGTDSGAGAFITSGYEPGTLGHAGRAGASSANAANSGDLFSRFYVNPYALGLTTTNNTRPVAFGTPLYQSLYPGTQISAFNSTSTTGRTGTGGGVGLTPGVTGTVGTTRPGVTGTTGITGGLGGLGGGIGGLGTAGFRTPAYYQTAIGFKYNVATPSERQRELQFVLDRSTALTSRNIRVDMDGPAVILRGTVTDPADRRVAENLLRLSPGVRFVRNEVTVAGP